MTHRDPHAPLDRPADLDGVASPAHLEQKIGEAGYRAADVGGGRAWDRHGQLILAGVCGVTLLAGWLGEGAFGLTRGVLALYLVSYVTGAWFGLIEVWTTLRAGAVDINFLMLLAAAGAAFIRQWHEGATLLFLFALSNALQTYALGRTRRAIEALVALRPAEACLLTGEPGAERESRVPLEAVPVGAVIRLRPGERVPLDAVIVRGASSVDESSLTGESLPIDRLAGDRIRAGTMNLNGSLDARVERAAADTTLARIIRLVEEARGEKARAQQAIDRFGAIYTWVVLAGAVATFFGLREFGGHEFKPAFYRTMVVLVVASPCALIISTPAAVLSAIGRGAKLGILFKGGAHLETMGHLKAVAFDKTGTLTIGRPTVTHVMGATGYSEDDVLRHASALERHSEHPLAEAVLAETKRRSLTPLPAEEVKAHPGIGIEGRIEGRRIRVGRPYLAHGTMAAPPAPGIGSAVPGVIDKDRSWLPPELAAALRQFEAEGATTMVVAEESRALGLIALADTVRPGAREALAALRRRGVEHLALISGDNEAAAHHVAGHLGMDMVRARVMPEDKVRAVRELREEFGQVAMIGDGVNDAPALAAATVGIAMGVRGTDAALETADVVLMKDDLGRLAAAVELGRSTRAVIFQNLTFAVAVIGLLVASSLGFGLPLAWGVMGHEGSTVLVVLNSLRLLAFRPHPVAGAAA